MEEMYSRLDTTDKSDWSNSHRIRSAHNLTEVPERLSKQLLKSQDVLMSTCTTYIAGKVQNYALRSAALRTAECPAGLALRMKPSILQ